MADLVFPDTVKKSGGGFQGATGVPDAGGTGGGGDPSLVSGQDPASFLGIPYSYSTGLSGTPPPGNGSPGAGGQGTPALPNAGPRTVNQPNQYPATEPISGVSLSGTGINGTQGAPVSQVEAGTNTVMVTDPNYVAGRPGGGTGIQLVSAGCTVGGPNDSTMVAGQYPPASPIIPGNFYPAGDGMGGGSVMVGGFKKGDRGGHSTRPIVNS